MRSNHDESQFDRPVGSDDKFGGLDAAELKELLGDEAQLADTRDSFDAIETLFERVRIPEEVAASFVTDKLSVGLAGGRESHLELPGFREKAVLGIGGFGTVFLAHDEKLERDVAVKVPRADRWLSDDRDRFLEEARLAAKLKHPGIVTLLELVEHDYRYHLVSELVDGETLQDLMDRGDIYWHDASKIAQAIAEAMAHAHEHQVVHRDLKPTNVLLDLDGQPKIADFGLAVRREAKSPEQVLAAGTLEYMSPEQLPSSEQSIDHRTDIWSFGVVLYELLTGELPFKGESRRELFEAIKTESPVPPRTIDNRIPKDLERLCLRCLMKEPEDRFASAAELASELKRVNNRTPWTPLVVLQRSLIAAVVILLLLSLFMTGGESFAPKTLTASMQINHLRFSEDGQTATDFGHIGERDEGVYQNDSINFAITFSEPAYFRLMELTSAGKVTTHYESEPDGEPVLTAEFPVERDFDLTLDDGPGSCIFAVVCSREPLGPLTEQELASIGWSSGKHEGVWQYNNGRLFQMVSPERSQATKRIPAPQLVSEACAKLDDDHVSVCAIAFPIETNPWRAQE